MIRSKDSFPGNMLISQSVKTRKPLVQGAPLLQVKPEPSTKRLLIFSVANMSFLLMIVTAGVINDTGNAESFTYLMSLFLICSSPLTLYDKLNGRYAILLIFMPILFMNYGLYELSTLFSLFGLPELLRTKNGMLSAAEVGILIGIIMLIAGYATSAILWKRKSLSVLRNDWKLSTITIAGLCFWIAGAAGTWIWQFGFADIRTATHLSNSAAIGLVVLRMIQPLGSLLLIYAYIVSRNKFLTVLITTMVAVDVTLGFAETSKELMIRSLVLLIVSSFLINKTVPKKWLITAAIVVTFGFSVVQAYRHEVLQLGNKSLSSALSNLSRSLEKALNSKMLAGGTAEAGGKLFVGRTNLKSTMDLVVTQTGKTVPYQHGYTLALLMYAFVPRLLMPDKPDSSVGQLFTRAFHTSEDRNTYTSTTFMGDLYWNFGWAGLVVGMYFIGAVLGAVGAGTNLSERVTVTRLLLILITVYLLCLRFEGGIALQFTLWIRTVVLILLMHLLSQEA